MQTHEFIPKAIGGVRHKKIFTETIYRNGKKIVVRAAALSYVNFQRYIQLKYGVLR